MTPEAEVQLRPAALGDAAAVASIWHRGWRDGHLGNVPEELIAVRTERSFRTRAEARVPDTTVAVVDQRVAGFIMVVGDEVEQVYLDTAHRGRRIAAVLLSEAERQVGANGGERAWLAVVAGNIPARRFYSKHGWVDEGLFDYRVPGPRGPISVPSHRYAKTI